MVINTFSNINSDIKNKKTFDVICYIPCHFNFSQVEFVAPFLERFGGKIFIYKWLGIKEKMKKYFEENYDSNSVQVIDFSLKNILRNLLKEKKKVVFLLTASMAYPFGNFQKELLTLIQNRVPDKIASISVIGHCMYGCMSCQGNDHKIPIYFTRYFCHRLPYTAESIKKQYFNNNKSKIILVSPSTGETSLVLQNSILNLLLKLQQNGEFQFIWKLHPSVFDLSDYDLQYEPHKREIQNIKFIMENFKVTDETQPCLLPFLEACDIIICDLHSTVPFMASYFSPKVIICFENDADYMAERDPNFLKNLELFQNADQLEHLLVHLPNPKGNRNFFHSIYGKVDGEEELRFAELAGWPTISNDDLSKKENKIYDFGKLLSLLCQDWKNIFKKNQNQEKETIEDCKQAMGLNCDCPLQIEEMDNNVQNIYTQMKNDCFTFEKKIIKIMTFNLWHGGEMSNYPLEKTADIILKSGADVVGLQETSGKPNQENIRMDNIKKLAELLGSWYYFEQGIIIPCRGCVHPMGILSKWKITESSPLRWGVKIEIENNLKYSFYLFNTHLSYFPYQPYQILSIPYEEAPFLKKEEEVIQSCITARKEQIDSIISDMKQILCKENIPIFLTGDFNEPSYQDWTFNSVIAGIHPMKVKWPSTQRFLEFGFQDVYRLMYPDEIEKPGFTWTIKTKEDDPKDHHDRIDYIFIKDDYRSSKLLNVEIVGENSEYTDIIIQPWTSDHRALIATFLLQPSPIPFIN